MSRTGHRLLRAAVAGGVGLLSVAGVAVPASIASASPAHPAAPSKGVTISSTGLKPGAIKHVWLIILENKSYDATFTGLNQNSYLWKTLPEQGVLLKNYYGTGHSSMDNYLSLVSGQAPQRGHPGRLQRRQPHCSARTPDIVHSTSTQRSRLNYGSDRNSRPTRSKPSGANAPLGPNGCTYPTDVPTLFNQLNAAGQTWKGYAQDLGGAQTPGETSFQANTVPGREAAAVAGPGTSANNPDHQPDPHGRPTSRPGVTSSPAAQPNDQYVAKHFPFPWFESLTGAVNGDGTGTPPLNEPSNGGTNCDANHIANLDSPTDGLVHDLQKQHHPGLQLDHPGQLQRRPRRGLQGQQPVGRVQRQRHARTTTRRLPYDPETTTPKNFTGGLYASDLFLEYYIPLIEQSPAFKDGGLIDVTFDEGVPAVHLHRQQLQQRQRLRARPRGPARTAAAADQDRHGRREPLRPQRALRADRPELDARHQRPGRSALPGPGQQRLHRPSAGVHARPARRWCRPTACPASSGAARAARPAARTDTVTGGASSSDHHRQLDRGRRHRPGGDRAPTSRPNSFVGAVTDTGPQFPTTNTGSATTGSFQLVSQDGTPVDPTGPVTSITLSAEGDPGDLTAGETPDPLCDATDPTPGGGDTGSVLISPFIKPGTSSTVYYNHYSWLRTMEDIFNVSAGHDHTTLPAGTVSGGLDGQGHLGYAAQPGLRAVRPGRVQPPVRLRAGGRRAGGGSPDRADRSRHRVAGVAGAAPGPRFHWPSVHHWPQGSPSAATCGPRRRGFALGRS